MYHLNQVPSETKIRKFLKQTVFGNHLFCPTCRRYDVVRYEARYRCRRCRLKFSLLSHTWLSNMKLPLPQFWLILWCWTKRMPVQQTSETVDLSEKAVRHHFDLFRTHLPSYTPVLEHIVQLDEVYFGGWKGRAILMGKQIGTKKLAYQVFDTDVVNRAEAVAFIKTHVAPNTQLNTDGSMLYANIEKWHPVSHVVDIHKRWEFGKTSEIEGMFGVMRTFIRRMYHHVSHEKLPEYICEFHYRFCRPEMFSSPRQYLLNTLELVPTG